MFRVISRRKVVKAFTLLPALPLFTAALLHGSSSSSTSWSSSISTSLGVGYPNKKLAMSNDKDNNNNKDLQALWEGGRDIWYQVPVDGINSYMNIQNRVRNDDDYDNLKQQMSSWPAVVRDSVLYGMGAYNPLGQIETDEYNTRNHDLLREDIATIIASSSHFAVAAAASHDGGSSAVVWWEAASIFPDDSMEKGFIVAYNKKILSLEQLKRGEKLIIDLAKKYRQGAVYKFEYQPPQQQEEIQEGNGTGRLLRWTVPVLVPDTDAMVEVVMDDSLPFPSSIFSS